METTPVDVSPEIISFLRTVGLDEVPEYLPFTSVSQFYLPRYCLNNCEEEVKAGGRVIFGWVVWEDRGAGFIETEFHSVIERSGKLADITPRLDGEEFILFVSDKTRSPIRIDERTWDTWTNIKYLHGKVVLMCEKIQLHDPSDSYEASRAQRSKT